MYVRASRNDEVIPFSGVVAYVRRLRECGANVVFKVDSVHGHHDNGDAKERATNVSNVVYLSLINDINAGCQTNHVPVQGTTTGHC